MKFHKEGHLTILITFVVLGGLLAALLYLLPPHIWLKVGLIAATLFLYGRIVFFFRIPTRTYSIKDNAILAPADGKIVAIEEVFEEEYLKQKCIQVSVFMSPTDIHINWIPTSGTISYYKYHPGKHLAAWHPKSSLLNERTSIGMKYQGRELLIRQVAGALARRIVCYAKEGMKMKQTEELGFIKFGSRVDLYLPLDSKLKIQLHELVVGGKTELAEIS
jgi:phosphatidylserine decarboxylase